MTKAQPLIVYLPDRRDVELSSRYTMGNNKLGPGVFTYSRLAGYPGSTTGQQSTCPGATYECEAICYAKQIGGLVKSVYATNSHTDEVPPIPQECRVLRIHVSGDFDTPEYILNWVRRLRERLDVTCWAYTRSWRCHSLLEFLEQLRALPNVQLFASMDPSTQDEPPDGWRRAWIWRDHPVLTAFNPWGNTWPTEHRLYRYSNHNMVVPADGTPAYVCPEETGRKDNCTSCRYCFDGRRNDVIFLEH